MTTDKEPKPSKRRGRPKKVQQESKPDSNIGNETLKRERNRTERVCRELLEGYTDGFSLKEDGGIEYSESNIASQWGLNRGKISRMIAAIYDIKSKNDSQAVNKISAKYHLVPLSLAELVEILGNLAQRKQPKKPLTKEDILRIIQRFIELLPEERMRLGLNPGNCSAIIRQIIKIVELGKNSEFQSLDLLSFYEKLLNKSRSYSFNLETAQEDSIKDKSKKSDENLEKLVKNILMKHKIDITDKLVSELVLDVKSEKRKIEAECGFTSFNKEYELDDVFIQLLIQSVVENELLNKEIPIYLKHYDIKRVRPLPLSIKDDKHINGVLNSSLNLDEWTFGIKRQHAYTVSLYLDVKLSDNFKKEYKILFPNYADFKVHEGKLSGQILPFYLESSGTGGQVTNLTRLVNLSLLKDIPCLQDYFPIAHDIVLVLPGVLQQNNSSPLAYHTLTMLCEKKYVEEASRQKKPYNHLCSDQQSFYGNYCGFDLLECSAQSSLFARIQAIKKIGKNTNTYITQFCNKIERVNQLRKASSYLKSYPFSMFAMQSHLEETILHEVLSEESEQSVSILESNIKNENFKRWSSVAREAYLEIIDAYLIEGLYKSANILIQKIESAMEFTKESETICNSTIRIKFEICLAKYYSIVDPDEYIKDNPNTNMSQAKLVQKALDHLNEAEKLLTERLNKYVAINEQAQSNFSPFFKLRSQILFYRAKLNLFYIIKQEQKCVKNIKERHVKQILFFEKARIFAAMDGDFEYYSYYSIYQAIAYIITAFIAEKPQPEFSRSECLDWATRLIEHAVICYSDVGNNSYQRIKEKSGIGTGDSPEEDVGFLQYGRYFIQNIPSIIEITKDNKKPFYFRTVLQEKVLNEKSDEDFIFLDMAALSVRAEQFKHFHVTHTPGIYLFGTYASIILFARALDTLCNAGSNSERNYFADVELASRMFTYAWATAEDSCVYTKLAGKSEDNIRLERRFFDNEKNKTNNEKYNLYWEKYYENFSDLYRKEIAYIKDIYPHRFNEIADFGKIFAGVCKYLLLSCNDDDCPTKQDLKKDIKELMNKLQINLRTSMDKPDYYSQQSKFNGHFEKAFTSIKSYMKNELENYETNNEENYIEKRDEVVKTIFKFLFEQDA